LRWVYHLVNAGSSQSKGSAAALEEEIDHGFVED
jgi:hypothetical protein